MAKIVARGGLRKVFEFWTVFPAKNQAFEEKFGFCRAAGMSFEVSVSVGRQFKSYAEAETFSLRHIAKLSGGLSGVLDYRNMLGVRFGFENAVLESVRVANEIGVHTEFEYVFRCGRKAEFPYAISVGGSVLSIGGAIPIVKE